MLLGGIQQLHPDVGAGISHSCSWCLFVSSLSTSGNQQRSTDLSKKLTEKISLISRVDDATTTTVIKLSVIVAASLSSINI